MKRTIDLTLNDSHIKGLAGLVVLGVLAMAGGWAACGGSDASSRVAGVLDMVPDSAYAVWVYDVDEILRGDLPLSKGSNFRSMEERWSDTGILIDSVSEMALTSELTGPGDYTGLASILSGEFDFVDIRNNLDDKGYNDIDYRGYELWESNSRDVALFEDDGYVVVGRSLGGAKEVLRSLDREDRLLVNDDENTLAQALERAGLGFRAKAWKDCGEFRFVRGCEAAGMAATKGDGFLVDITIALVFGTEREAQSAESDVEDWLDNIQSDDQILEFEYEDVIADGPFIVVKSSIDQDAFHKLWLSRS